MLKADIAIQRDDTNENVLLILFDENEKLKFLNMEAIIITDNIKPKPLKALPIPKNR